METVTIQITGMTCSSCVRSITKVLNSVPGVEKAEVSLEKENAVVTFDKTKTNADTLIAAIENGGFDASL